MDIIEKMDPVSFSEYLREYQNTICGRHPIGVLLNVSTLIYILVNLDVIDWYLSKISGNAIHMIISEAVRIHCHLFP